MADAISTSAPLEGTDKQISFETGKLAGQADGSVTVRTGDTVVLGSLEYRFHLPRALGIEEEPTGRLFGEPFRWRPQQPYGRPDWDLIFKAFVDAGRAINSDRLAFEKDETLIGAGVGVELQVKRFLSLRVDWGMALEDVNEGLDDEVEAGDNRVHFVATLVF